MEKEILAILEIIKYATSNGFCVFVGSLMLTATIVGSIGYAFAALTTLIGKIIKR